VYKICRLVYGTKRLEICVNIVHCVLAENIVEKLIEFGQSVRIIRQAKMMLAATVNTTRF